MIDYLAIIPARGGSKRVNRKNLQPIAGIPLVCHSLKSVLGSSLRNNFLVSSEDHEILDVCEKFLEKKIQYLRPASLADDLTRNSATMIHAIKWYEDTHQISVRNAVLLQPTSPFRSSEDIDNAIEIHKNSQLDVLASVTGPYKKRHSPFKMVSKGRLVDLVEYNPSQAHYVLNASIYIVSTEYLRKYNKFTSDEMAYYVMPEERSFDIDTPFDLKLAQALGEQ